MLAVAALTLNQPSVNREQFVTVTEDYMLLGVGVIAVASFVLYVTKWDQVSLYKL